MRRSVLGLVVASLLVSSMTTTQATEKRKDAAQPIDPSISSVTDANGNPISLRQHAVDPSVLDGLRAKDIDVQRGQDWWAYSAALPPYTAVDRRAESMAESEIQVNGVAIIDTRDVEAAFRLMPAELKLERDAQLARTDGFYLVKISGFRRSQEQIDALTQAGATLGEYLNINTYIAKIPSSSVASVRALPFVTYVGDYQPAYKVSPRIGLERVPIDEAIDAATGEPKPWVFELVLHKGAYVLDVLNDLARIGVFPTDKDILSNDALTLVRVTTYPGAVAAIAQIPGVKWIAEKSYPKLDASSTNPATIPMMLQNNATYTTSTATGWKLWNANIDGRLTNQVVTMMDSGLNTKLFHFSQDTVNHGTLGPLHRKVVGYDAYGGGGDLCILDDSNPADGGHGAKTSQHAVGSISNMTSNPDVTHTPNTHWDNGIARGAKLYFQDIGNSAGGIGPPGDLGPSITAAIAKGSFVQNHSWGAATNSYDSQASLLDTALFNNLDMVVTVSAGNRGAQGDHTLGSPSTAKNAICVGGNDVSNPNGLFIDCNFNTPASCGPEDLGSSRGPVNGANRIKPDIMAFIFSTALVGGERMAYAAPTAMCQTDATKTPYFNYTNAGFEGGTSFAAPEIAGLAALVRDYFQQGFYPSGTAIAGNAFTPRGSLVKAVLLASGEDMNATSTPSSFPIDKRYSKDVGYGRANLPGVLHIGASAPHLWVQNGDSLGFGATKSFSYTINGNAIPLRVMMVYYDSAGDALQKDADLKVTVGGSTVYWGNNFNAGWSTSATSTRDHTNNTEGVFLDAAHGLPASGTVQVEVIGFNNPGGMSYSLVVSGNVASAAVQQVSIDQGAYTCNETVNITVNDTLATSPISVTVVSKNAVSTTIDTEVVSCTGGPPVFSCTLQTGSGITVVDGGSLTFTYGAALPVGATIDCQADLVNAGSAIGGGCDNVAAGTNPVTGPLTSGGVNEYYAKYFDAGEYSTYRVSFVNNTGAALTDATVALSFSGGGASAMSALNGPIQVGAVPAGATAGAVFQLFTNASAASLPFPTSVNLNFSLTSPGDGYTTPTTFSQTQFMQANDTIARQNRCSTFTGGLTPWAESLLTCTPACTTNPWRWVGAATAPATVGSENRTDTLCGNATANNAAMTGNSGIGAGFNFNNRAASLFLQNFQPALTGNAPNGQPYRFEWRWHSFYKASETLLASTGWWAVLYNHQWNSPVNPTADQAFADPPAGFPFSYGFFTQNQVFDNPPSPSWDWNAANTGTPDNYTLPSSSQPPNQFFINFVGVSGLATPATYFSYGHSHVDAVLITGTATSTTSRRDIALDNDNLVYDEFFMSQQGAACTPGTQPGQVAFNSAAYAQCAGGTALISVADDNGVSGLQVTVTSAGTGDSEVVTLTGSAPYFSATLNLSSTVGAGANNGTLFVVPVDTLNATYTDGSPVGASSAVASVNCPAGDVQYVANVQIVDNGDNDGLADNNECVTMDVSIWNNTANPITNTKVTIVSNNTNVDLIQDDHAYYGMVAAGATVVNPVGDRFRFHVNEAVACSNPATPPVASFTVIITADGIAGAIVLQTFQLSIDLDVGGGTTSYTQNFTADPGWTVGVTPPLNAGCGVNAYTNNFHWCAACGNASGGYGAWIGNAAFGTVSQNYTSVYNSSTLYSPVFTAAGATTLQFRTAFRTEVEKCSPPITYYDGGLVQYRLGAGAWTNLAYSTPAQNPVSSGSATFCSPLLPSTAAFGGEATGTTWTLTNAAAVPSSNGQSVQFRWWLGGDESANGNQYGGFGVDDVSVTGLRQFVCEPANNPNAACCVAPGLLVNNAAADVNLCVNGGIQVTWPQDPDLWGDGGAGTRTYDVLRNGSPIATGIPYGTTTHNDATAVAGVTYSYTVRYNNGCGGQTTTTGASKADSNNVTCTPSDQCHNAGVCAPATGACSNPPKANGSGCTDGDLCTQTDTCQSGACIGGNPITCFQQDECHQIGTCSAGVCSNPVQPNGTPCDDLNFCTTGEACTSGTCGGGSPNPPPEIQNHRFSNDKTTLLWDSVPNSPTYDVLRGAVGAFPVGPGGGDETCFNGVGVSIMSDGFTPTPNQGVWYVIRATTICGIGTFGTQKDLTPRTSTTCP